MTLKANIFARTISAHTSCSAHSRDCLGKGNDAISIYKYIYTFVFSSHRTNVANIYSCSTWIYIMSRSVYILFALYVLDDTVEAVRLRARLWQFFIFYYFHLHLFLIASSNRPGVGTHGAIYTINNSWYYEAFRIVKFISNHIGHVALSPALCVSIASIYR